MIAGYFNSKHPSWNSRTTNQNRRILRKHFDENNYEVIGPQHPTHYSAPHRLVITDLVIIKNLNHYFDLEVTQDLDSDHNAVILKIGDDTTEHDHVNTKKTNWKLYEKYLQTNTSDIKQINNLNELEEAIYVTQQDITTALEHATQYSTRQIKNPNDVPPELNELIRQKKKSEKESPTNKEPS